MKEVKRDYTMTDPILTLKCEDVLDSIDRDTTEFTAHGLTTAKRDAFEDSTTEFDGMHSDNYWKGLQQIKTHDKDVIRETAETQCSTVFTAVENVWGLHSNEYHLFAEDKPMSQLSDAEFLRFLEDFADSTEDKLSDLAGEGIDTATVTALRAIRVDFNNGLKAQRKAIKDRNTGNSDRIKKGNLLYASLVKLCNTGKNIWLDVDESKHNDYVIYHPSSGGPASTVHFNLGPGQILILENEVPPVAPPSVYARKTGDAAGEIQIYYGLTPAQAYSGTGFHLADNHAHIITPEEPGTIATYLMAQNTSAVSVGLDFAVIA